MTSMESMIKYDLYSFKSSRSQDSRSLLSRYDRDSVVSIIINIINNSVKDMVQFCCLSSLVGRRR